MVLDLERLPEEEQGKVVVVVLVDEIFVRLDLFNLDLLVGHLLPLSLGVPLPAPLIVLFSFLFLFLEAVFLSPNEIIKKGVILQESLLAICTPFEEYSFA